jgi:WD40 repeat protein
MSRRLRVFELPPPHRLAWSPDGRWLVASSITTPLSPVDTWQLSRLPPIEPNLPPAGAAVFSRPEKDGVLRYLAAVSGGIRIVLLKLPERSLAATLQAPRARDIYHLKFSRDNRWLGAATANGEVHLWNLPALRTRLAELGLDWE